ncbi:protein LYRIC isoform X6 [Ochotona curzoniae]|uniref:protein LYRIC isoform X6 n=1 Tax=Ochotona curzoniae TaxID=130825 RepID=UPI001B34A8D9|nr:protein LYRIC isoform X6 [Ochotona curzoniae]
MAARSWQDELAQQAEEGSARLREMLSAAVGFLRTELGLDLGLEPKRYPGWVILVGTGALGLLLLLLLGYGWAAACAGARKKRRNPPRKREEATATPASTPDDPASLKNLKGEEPKKKNRKKLPEKPKPNGRTVDVAEDDVVRTPRSVTAKQPPETDKKNEKSKKNKKKSKSDAKAVQNSSRHDGKEVDEVSSGLNENLTVNGGGWNEKSVKLSSQMSAGEEKWNSVPSATAGKRKAEPSAWNQDPGDNSTNGKDWGRNWSERSIFSGIAAWSSVDRGMNTSEQNSASFASLTLNSAVSGSAAEPGPQSAASDYQWDISRNQPYVDDEWSGLNGLSSADPSSDWNAPAEEWGNWVDEERASLLKSQEAVPDDQKISDDDKEKGEGALPSGKSKKKKKKKKKQGEENSPAQDTEELEKEIREELPVNTSKSRPKQEKAFSSKTISTSDAPEVLLKNSQPIKTLPPAVSAEPSVSLSTNDSDKSSSQVPETDKSKSNTKQNSVPPSQTKSETNWESPKQIKKKKKARRET